MAENPRTRRLRQIFNLTDTDYDAILAEQDNGCGICHRPPPPGKHLAVDHKHAGEQAGLIRGILCMRCNRSLARFSDDPVLLLNAVRYLQNPPATRALGAPRMGLPGRVNTKKMRRLIKRIRKLNSAVKPAVKSNELPKRQN